VVKRFASRVNQLNSSIKDCINQTHGLEDMDVEDGIEKAEGGKEHDVACGLWFVSWVLGFECCGMGLNERNGALLVPDSDHSEDRVCGYGYQHGARP